jgi:hypothetical protein
MVAFRHFRARLSHAAAARLLLAALAPARRSTKLK